MGKPDAVAIPSLMKLKADWCLCIRRHTGRRSHTIIMFALPAESRAVSDALTFHAHRCRSSAARAPAQSSQKFTRWKPCLMAAPSGRGGRAPEVASLNDHRDIKLNLPERGSNMRHAVAAHDWPLRPARLGAVATFLFGASALMLVPTRAAAVASFARQTGLACEACHIVPPELTPFGRRFKLNGYTLTTRPPLVSDIDDYKKNTVWLVDIPGISLLVQATYNHYDKAPPDSVAPYPAHAQSDNVQFPQQISFMYAGAISDHVGTFLQVSYLQPAGTFGLDNTDIRYSDHTANNDGVWGVTLNDNPSVQDVWNTNPAGYGIPGFSTQTLWSAPVIAGASLRVPIMSELAEVSAGLGGYVWYKDSVYLELTGYKAAKAGSVSTTEDSSNLSIGGGTLVGVAPYWRAGYEYDWGYNSAFIGTTGMYAEFEPYEFSGQTINPGYVNRYTDISGDWQYQYNGEHNTFAFLGHYTHETQANSPDLVPTYFTNSTDHLNEFQVTGEYFRDRHFGTIVSFRRTTGTNDVAFNGGTGSPTNQYEVFELDYLPWFNFRFILQYNVYQVVDNNQNPFFLRAWPHPQAAANNTFVFGLWMDF
jgi:iron:rusticyanin reductase